MSSGVVHTRASLLLAGGFLVGTFLVRDWNLLQSSAGALLGIICTPDLDVDAGYIGGALIRKYTGGVGQWIWETFWSGYSKSLKHGCFLSHFPVIGTVGRIAYVVMLTTIVASILGWNWDIRPELNWWLNILYDYWLVVYGLMYADTIHWALDVLTKETKTPLRK